VKRILSDWFESQNWEVSVEWRKSRGPDILATKRNMKWIVEAKGQSSRKSIRISNFYSAIGEILQSEGLPIVWTEYRLV
jgi:hypothetical protein